MARNIRSRETKAVRFVDKRRTLSTWENSTDEDPLAGIANLFDISVAFIVALLIALFTLFAAGDLVQPNSDVTIVKKSSNGEMEIITKRGTQISVQRVTDSSLSGQGTRLGTAYRLANGQVVYVPDASAGVPDNDSSSKSGNSTSK